MNAKNLFALLTFAVAYAAFAAPASASLDAVSPESSPLSGFPLWYHDSGGTSLELCLDQNGFCALPPEFDPAFTNPPFHIGAIAPGSFPDESAYWKIESTMYDAGIHRNGTARFTIALEGRFATGEGIPEQGKQKTLLGMNLQMSGVELSPDSAYKVTHPFGSFIFYTDSSGAPVPGAKGHIFKAEDGCRSEPCDFSEALFAFNTSVTRFLGWDGGPVVDSATGKKYVGDGKTPHAIEAGPGGASFILEGPDAGGPGKNKLETGMWIVSGKLADIAPQNITGPKVFLSDNHAGPFVKGPDSVLITADFESASGIAEGADAPRITIGADVIDAPMTMTSNLVWTYLWNVPSGSEGVREVMINAKDAGGNPNAPAAGKKYYLVDNTAPAAPFVAFPSSDVFLDSGSISISGIAEPNSLVRVMDANDGTILGSQQLAGGLRDFRILASLLQNAENKFTVTATDAAGNEGPAAVVPTITEDNANLTVALSYNPARPVRDADNIIITAMFAGLSPVNESAIPKISIDYAGNGSDITGAEMSKTSNFVWTYVANVPAGNDGVARIKIDAKNNAGGANLPAFNNKFIVDNTPPPMPAVVSPGANLSVNAFAFDIRGSAEEASLVKLYSGQSVVRSQQFLRDAVTYGLLTSLLQNAENKFTVTATDAAGNEGPAAVVPTITEDSIAPNITGAPASSVTHDTAAITWATDEQSTTLVLYGTTTDTLLNASGAAGVISHSVAIGGLAPSTQYFYNVSSCDAAGNCAYSGQFSFTTLAAPIAPPAPPSSGGGGGGGTSSGGGSGGGGSICLPNWNCTPYSACSNGIQARACNDIRKCGTSSGKPALNRTCSVPVSVKNITNLTNETVRQPEIMNEVKRVTLPAKEPMEQKPAAITGMFFGITSSQWLWVLIIWIAAAMIANHYRKKWLSESGEKKEEL